MVSGEWFQRKIFYELAKKIVNNFIIIKNKGSTLIFIGTPAAKPLTSLRMKPGSTGMPYNCIHSVAEMADRNNTHPIIMPTYDSNDITNKSI